MGFDQICLRTGQFCSEIFQTCTKIREIVVVVKRYDDDKNDQSS